MKSKKLRLITAFLTIAMCFSTSNLAIFAEENMNTYDINNFETLETSQGIAISNDLISTNNFKSENYNNPISSDFFCADPTTVEYNGRLYLFGTNDHQQYEEKGADLDNTYEKIKSFVILSTDDMVNWIYHGEIDVSSVAPWITNSWAPSIVSRVEDDGLTHFYLYFSNNGLGVGVITATNPLGPWEDPLGKPLITASTPGLKDCPNPFDPGVVIDDNGDGWLSFGGGKASNGTTYMPGSSRIVKLGDDMLSFASDFTEIPAPYFFEASELNYINDTYVYTYNSDWSDHSEEWNYDCPAPTSCSMVYMTTKTPLDPTSWEMKGEYFKNPGLSGFDYSNNHTHIEKFNDNYYIFYHTLMLKNSMGIKGGYRSLCVDKITVDEQNVTIEKTGGTKKGVNSISNVDPFSVNIGAELNNTTDISIDTSNMQQPTIISNNEGSWISVKNVEFTPSENTEEPPSKSEFVVTGVDSIKYNITVTSVDKDTTVSMYPSTKANGDCVGYVDITGNGKYTITCDLDGTEQLQNLGYFKASDDALITFMLDSITINDKYNFDISTELTNTRDWADGLKNIWNGFSDGDEVYTSDNAVLKYIASDDAIELFVSPQTDNGLDENSAPVLEEPLTFLANVKGTGRIEVRLDNPTGELLTSVDFDNPNEFKTIYNNEVAKVGGTHNLYFVLSNEDISLNLWQFSINENSNDDNKKEAIDILKLKKYILGISNNIDTSFDLNNDNIINITDLVLLKNLLFK